MLDTQPPSGERNVQRLMALKAQMNYRRPADERELVMYACFVIGLLIPLLEFSMRAGPVSFIGWVGSEVAKDKAGSTEMTVFRGFTDTHLQMAMLGLQTTESLFTWLNVLAELLLGLGFFQKCSLDACRRVARR